jgi:hypothetical protein
MRPQGTPGYLPEPGRVPTGMALEATPPLGGGSGTWTYDPGMRGTRRPGLIALVDELKRGKVSRGSVGGGCEAAQGTIEAGPGIGAEEFAVAISEMLAAG